MGKRLWLFLACLALTAGMAFAQQKVTGTVIDSDTGEPVVGAAVMVKGTSIGTATDVNGKFTIASVPSSAKLLRITYLGMKEKEVAVKPSLKIYMDPDTKVVDEVMVIAYGTQKKSSFTGSAVEIKAKDIEDHVTSSVTSVLAGKAPGVQLTSTSGEPGSAPTIRIRGIGSLSASNSPLYIVDGMPFDSPISSLNPNDIATLNVLKDAAASAIYGARGANGVVIITTKNGHSQDAEVKFDAKWGSNSRLIPQYDVISDPRQYFETQYRAMYNAQVYAGASAADAYAYADANIFNQLNGGLGYQIFTVPAGEKLIGTNFKMNPNATLGYSDGEYYYRPDDWYDETFHNSFRQEYNLSVSGKSERLNYYASVGYLNDGGIIENSKMQRYTSRVKADYQAKKFLKVGTNISFTHVDSDSPSTTDTWGSTGNAFWMANTIAPIFPLYVRNADGTIMRDENGKVYDANQTNFKRPAFMGNPMRDNMLDSRKMYRDIFSGKWYAQITPIEGLTLTANFGASLDNSRTNRLYSRFGSQSSTDGAVSVYNYRYFGVNAQYLANYQFTVAEKHNFDILAGYEQYRLKTQYLGGSNDHLFNPFIGELGNASGVDNKTVTSNTTDYMTEGFLGRVQYDYEEKYFLSASYRRDASSRFAPGHRWGSFGSVGAAWQLNKENFLASEDWINLLKFKVSYGIQGNDGIGSNDYPYADRYATSYNPTTGEYSVVMNQKGNEELTWETSHSFNVGFDFSLFNYRLNGTFEYFNRSTKDLLYYKPLSLSSGYPVSSYPTNIGSVRNSGIEFSLDGVVIKKGDFEWDLNLNLAHYTNKITKLDPSVKEKGIAHTATGSIWKEGGSVYEAYMKKFAGVNRETGAAQFYYDYEVKDPNDPTKKKTVTGITEDLEQATYYDLGSTLPDLYGGFGTTLSYKGFDLSAQFSFQLGGRIYDGQYQEFMHNGAGQRIGSNWHKDILKSWTPENPDSKFPRLMASAQDQLGASQTCVDMYLTSSDYLSINNITLGYTLPKRWLLPAGIAGLRVYVAAENLAVFSARKGLDPRFSLAPSSINYGAGGSDGSSASSNYSATRTITAGISLTF